MNWRIDKRVVPLLANRITLLNAYKGFLPTKGTLPCGKQPMLSDQGELQFDELETAACIYF